MSGPDRPRRSRIHAALVHFPISAWTGAALLQLTAPFHDRTELAGIDLSAAVVMLLWIGMASAACAAFAGLVELVRLPDDARVAAVGNRHMMLMGSAFTCFLLAALSNSRSGALALPQHSEYVLHALGLALLVAGAHAGGHLNELANRGRAAEGISAGREDPVVPAPPGRAD